MKSLDDSNNDNMIFIVGSGRSGTSVFFDILTRHPDLSWPVEKIMSRWPQYAGLNRYAIRLMRTPVIGVWLRKYLEPGEVYPYWNRLYRGFGPAYRDLLAEDVTEYARDQITGALHQLALNPGSKLILKITGWNRIGFLNEIYPEAKFIHISRDPRAVISSSLNVKFWRGWRGPYHLLSDGYDDEYREELQRFGGSFVALAGMRYVSVHRAYCEARKALPSERLIEINYEDMCSDPLATYEKVCKYLDIEWSGSYQDVVANSGLTSMNTKWRENLTERQQDIVQYYYDKVMAMT